MSNREMTNTERVIGLGIVGLLIYGLVVFVSNQPNSTSSRTPISTRQPSSLTVSRTNTPRPMATNTLASTNRVATASPVLESSSNYGQRVDVADELVTMAGGIEFRQCQQMACPLAGVTTEGQRLLITAMIGGDVVEGIQLWVVAVDSDGNEGYAPMVYVFPPTPTETATP